MVERYATAEDLRAQVDVNRTIHDSVLDGMLEAASRAIDGICNRPDGFLALAVGTERRYPGNADGYISIGECVAVTSVKAITWDSLLVETQTALTDWYAYKGSFAFPVYEPPYTAIMLEGSFPESKTPNIAVVARWGYADAIPALVRQATITIAARWWMRGRSAWSDAVMPEGGGTLLYRQVVDPDVILMLSNGRLIRGAAIG